MSKTLTTAILKCQDDVCSASVITLLKSTPLFQKLAKSEGELIVQRDAEDEAKLSTGIDISIKKKIIKKIGNVPKSIQINVMGLSSDDVADRIVQQLPSKKGNVIILQGLSGTGKGTTVQKLKGKLPRCVTWSNGNVFRSYTYLAHELLKQDNKPFTTENLTEKLITSITPRITFDEFEEGQYDIIIDKKTKISEIENTLLKAPLVSQTVPTMAQLIQGEVICFGKEAVRILSSAGYNVILEGRAQTLNYITTPLRFELIIPDVAVLGERRAAQRVMATALALGEKEKELMTDEHVQDLVTEALKAISL